MTEEQARHGWIGRAVCLAALVWCGIVLLFHWVAAGIACGLDTSYCAQSRHKDGLYRGTLLDRQGRALTDTSFSVAFESRRRAHARDVGGFSTDAHGNYCIVWAQERVNPFAHLDDGSEITIDAAWQPLNGADPPPNCQTGDHGIPWNRADDLKSTPQFVSVPAVVLPGVALLLFALLPGGTPGARRVRIAGLVLTLASTLLAATLWFV